MRIVVVLVLYLKAISSTSEKDYRDMDAMTCKFCVNPLKKK